jgi:hypothetical protein
MESETQDIKNFFQIVIVGTLSCIILGYLFFQSNVFQLTHSAFGFILFGLMGSTTFAVLRSSSVSKAAATLLILVVLNEVLTKPPEWHFIVRDVLFALSIGTSVFVFHRMFYKQLSVIRMARPLILGSLIAVSATLVTVVLLLVLSAFSTTFRADPMHSITVNLSIGFLIGIGMGIGFELVSTMRSRTVHQPIAENANGG